MTRDSLKIAVGHPIFAVCSLSLSYCSHCSVFTRVLLYVGPQIACVLAAEAVGTTVVDETLRLVAEASIFPDDYGLLRRAAWVETTFGIFGGIFDEGIASGDVDNLPTGLWQMDNARFAQTQDVATYPVLAERYRQIRENLFGIIWEDAMYEDLNRPLYSAVAVRLYLSTLEAPIPQTFVRQARFWYETYHGETDDLVIDDDSGFFAASIVDPATPIPEPADDAATGSKICEYN